MPNQVGKNHVEKQGYLEQFGVTAADYTGNFRNEFQNACNLINDYDFEGALEVFENLAERDDIDSQFNAATILSGHPTLRNEKKALYWFKKASENGSIRSTGALGSLYREMEDYKKAKPFLEKAANAGDTDSIINLSIMYWMGEGISVNEKEGVRLMELAVEQSPNFLKPHVNLIDYYLYLEELEKADEMYSKASKMDTDFVLEKYEKSILKVDDAETFNPPMIEKFRKSMLFWKKHALQVAPEEAARIEAEHYTDPFEKIETMRKSQNSNSGCFIATAVYGDYDAQEVKTLRYFRDEFLLKSKVGSKFVEFYYKKSPALALYVERKHFLQQLIRILALEPLVRIIEFLRRK